jgi:Putative Zn-dependent protease, contains TPR repeats
VSERERLYIEARYFTTVRRDQPKAIESYRLLLATYPDDYAGHSNLGSLYRDRNMTPDAIKELEEAIRLAPGQPISRTNLGYAYVSEERWADARREFEEVLKLQESGSARNGLYTIATFTGDTALADAQMQAVKGRRDEMELTLVRAHAAGYKGQLKEAERLADDVLRQFQSTNRMPQVAQNFIGLAMDQALVGRKDTARAMYERIEKLKVTPDNAAYAMVALSAIMSEPAIAQPYTERALQFLRKSTTSEHLVANETATKALVALAAGRNEEAYDLAIAAGVNPGEHNAPMVAGVAALRLQRFDDAAKALTTMFESRQQLGMSAIVACGYVMLGRAHAGAHRAAEARHAYDEAFKLWKDADPDLPLLVEAKKQYAALD